MQALPDFFVGAYQIKLIKGMGNSICSEIERTHKTANPRTNLLRWHIELLSDNNDNIHTHADYK